MPKRKGQQKGSQLHGEGEHGAKTHSRLIKQLHEAPPAESVEERIERQRVESAYEGKRRLVEDREQHDEAEKNSERNQLHRADYELWGPGGLEIKE